MPRPIKKPVPRPVKRDAEATRQKLLTAAMQLFSSVGYEATTTKHIAKKAKVNEALIQRYFESKEGLLLALFHFIKTSGEISVLSIPPAASLEEELVQFFKLRIRHALEREKHMKLILSRAIVDAKLAEQMSTRLCGEKGMPGLKERLQYWKDKGAISPSVNIEESSFGISGYAFVVSFFGQLIFKMSEDELNQGISEMAKLFARGLKP